MSMSTYATIYLKCRLTVTNHFFIYIVCYQYRRKTMKVISKEAKTVKSTFNDEFENYLKKQQVKTTFNGSEVESFSWYRKALGLA